MTIVLNDSVQLYWTFDHTSWIPDLLNQVCARMFTSIGFLSLQTLSVENVDLGDQLRVATHARPARLRRLVQGQLSEAINPESVCHCAAGQQRSL